MLFSPPTPNILHPAVYQGHCFTWYATSDIMHLTLYAVEPLTHTHTHTHTPVIHNSIQVVKKFPTFYETQRFITVFTTAR